MFGVFAILKSFEPGRYCELIRKRRDNFRILREAGKSYITTWRIFNIYNLNINHSKVDLCAKGWLNIWTSLFNSKSGIYWSLWNSEIISINLSANGLYIPETHIRMPSASEITGTEKCLLVMKSELPKKHNQIPLWKLIYKIFKDVWLNWYGTISISLRNQ